MLILDHLFLSGIVITDGKSSNVHQTKSEASLAKTASGIVMLVIGVGKRTLQTELEAMASSPSTLFNVSDFSALIDIVETLRDQICEGKRTVKTHSTL